MSDGNGGGGLGVFGVIIGALVVATMFLGAIIFILGVIVWPIWLILLLQFTFGDREMLGDNDTNRKWRANPGQRANDISLNWLYFGIYTLVLGLFAAMCLPGITGFFGFPG